MFNFNNAAIFTDPTPHFILDNALDETLANNIVKYYDRQPPKHYKHINLISSFFDNFEKQLKSETSNIIASCHEIFDVEYSPCSMENIIYYDECYPDVQIIRDVHRDGGSKKFQPILYLGDFEDGQFEFVTWDKVVTKQILPKHNRLLVFLNTPESTHRYWSTGSHRRTINFPIEFLV